MGGNGGDVESRIAATRLHRELTGNNPETISQRLAEYSKSQGSSDNITVIVVFLTPPTQIAARPLHSHPLLADVDLDNMDENNEYLSNANGEYETQTSFFKQAQNRATINVSNFDEDTSLFAYGKSSNGKNKNRRVGYNDDEDDDDDDEDDEEDDDLGPETDVDAVDDAGEINTLANVSRELFLDKDSADDFHCENTVDDDTPMISSITSKLSPYLELKEVPVTELPALIVTLTK
ncbi:hypothetical protein PV326_010960 [Microctonus aethiopoides]|nr:hypothetical protein PV326_010960 [Microctonus aethiopoides]